MAGALVTHAIFEDGVDLVAGNFRQSYFGKLPSFPFYNIKGWRSAAQSPIVKEFSDIELNFILMHQASAYEKEPGLAEWCSALIQEADVVTLEYSMFATFLGPICRRYGKPLIVTCPDALCNLIGSTVKSKELLLGLEVMGLQWASGVFFVSENDRQFFSTHGIGGEVVVNTVDTEGIPAADEGSYREAVKGSLGFSQEGYVLFVGSGYGPNIQAAASLKDLASRYPQIAFVVAGECRPAERTGNFFALGRVSELTLNSLYRGAEAALIPLTSGGGTSLKLMEALAYGKPVISTSIGARGHAIQSGREAIIHDRIEDFAELVIQLRKDPQRKSALAEAARSYARAHDCRRLFAPYGETINRLLGRTVDERHQPARPRSLILLDSDLKSPFGHNLPYTRAIAEEAERRGIRFLAIGNQDSAQDISQQLPFEGRLTIGAHDFVSDNPYPREWGQTHAAFDFYAANQRFLEEMTTALARHASERDVVFIPNATHRHILAVATYLYRSPLTIAPEFVLLLRYDISASYRDGAGRLMRNINPIYGALYKLAFDRLNDCTTPHSVRLYSDSAELAQEYQNVCARPVECLPIPHTQADAPLQQGDLAPIRRPDVIRIVYLGDARAEKGFALLPAIVQATNARGLATKVEFVFQAYISSSYHQEMEQYIHELRSIGAPNVTLLERALSSEEYHALVHSADIVLILYDQGTYACRTSGPFTEALCAGKPVIVPDCTWMSRQLQGSGAGVVYDGVTIGDLLSAVFRAIETVSSLKHGAELLGEKLRKYHNPERFLSMLMGEQS